MSDRKRISPLVDPKGYERFKAAVALAIRHKPDLTLQSAIDTAFKRYARHIEKLYNQGRPLRRKETQLKPGRRIQTAE